MKTPAIVMRHPSLRWLVPAAVVGVSALVASGLFHATASHDKLPKTSPAALIAAAQSPEVTGFSGTIVSRMSLGLPELPSLGNDGDGAAMSSLLSGSHTLQVWYGGPTHQRVALLGPTAETDLFRSGRQLWQWNSAERTAVHGVLPKKSHEKLAAPASVTPSDLAHGALAALSPSTRVSVRDNITVANRSAYELVLRPRDARSRVGMVRISLDGKTKMPLGVKVYARGARAAAIDVAFTSIRFVKPANTYFEFSPPKNATIRHLHLGHAFGPQGDVARRLDVLGTNWTSIVSYRTGKHVKLSGPLKAASIKVDGKWGHGRLVQSELFTALVTSDGRVYAGAVDPDALYAAAAK